MRPAPAPLITSNVVERLETPYDIVRNWEFLLKAMNELREKARADYTPETWFKMLCRVTALNHDGLICILKSKNNKKLGFGCGFSAEDFDMNKCFYVWQAYSTGQCHTTLSELLAFCEGYAVKIGHTKVKTSTPRMTGAADSLFTQTLGFDREFYTYTKNV